MDSHRETVPNPEGNRAIFLSSNFSEDEHLLDARYPLRQAIINFAPSLSVPLVTWESLKERFQKDEDILTLCRQAIESCSLFVLLLGKRHGSGVRLDRGTSSASYLEMEIFTAAILKKPILVLHEASAEPNPLLRELLKLFRDRFSSVAYRDGNIADLCEGLADAARTLAEAGDLRQAGSLLGVPDFLAATRLQTDLAREMRDPRLRFLNGSSIPQTPGASFVEIERTLAAIDTGNTAHSEGHAPITQGAVLFRVWAAMRDLAASDDLVANKPEQPGSLGCPINALAKSRLLVRTSWLHLSRSFGRYQHATGSLGAKLREIRKPRRTNDQSRECILLFGTENAHASTIKTWFPTITDSSNTRV